MISLIVVVVYFIGRFGLGIADPQVRLLVPDISLVLASISAIFSAGAIALRHRQPSFSLGLTSYILLAITGGVLIELTGGNSSPFIALWLIIGVFAAMFGSWVWLTIFTAANVHLVHLLLFTGHSVGLEEVIRLLLAAEAPLIASFIIWHKEATKNEAGGAKAYNALAAQLNQVANKSEIVINSIADCVVALDAQGIIQLINPAAQNALGWTKQDAVGLNHKSVIKLLDANGQEVTDELSPIRQVVLSNKPLTDNNLSLTTKSGKKILIALTVTPVGDEARANGVILVFRDVTNEKQQERQRGEFISTASHEMRTPVAAMEGYLALAMNPQTATIDDKARSYLQKAYESTQHLGRLFQDLLTVSKAEDGRLVPRAAAVDAIAFTREIVDVLAPKAKAKNIGLVYTPGGAATDTKHLQPSYYMYVDPSQMREVLSNLIDNAIKYTKQGTVTVGVNGDANNIAISIADTGIGIAPEDVPHLFQKFYRVDNSDTREIGGTGLGLFISRRLVEANNGHLELNSVYGKGSTFTVQVPRISSDKASEIINRDTEQAAAAKTAASANVSVTAGPPPAAPITTPPTNPQV